MRICWPTPISSGSLCRASCEQSASTAPAATCLLPASSNLLRQAQEKADRDADGSVIVGFQPPNLVFLEPFVHGVACDLFHGSGRRIGVEQLHRVLGQLAGVSRNRSVL